MTGIAPAASAPSGLGYMAQAAAWFSLMSVFVKLAGETLPPLQIVFVRACITLSISAALLWRARVPPLGHRRGLLLLRGLIGSGGLLCFFFAVVHMPLADATVIHQTSPLFTALLAAWLLGERLEGRVVVWIVASLCGVLLIAQPDWLFGAATTGPGFDWQFAGVPLLGAILAALAYVTVRRLGASENPLVIVFYFPLVTVPLTAPFALREWVEPDWRGWAFLAGVGATTQLAQLALTRGLARERAGRATLIGYLQVAMATLLGAAVFGAWPTPWSWGGMGLILVSLLLGTRGART